MINKKDWKQFTELLDIEKKVIDAEYNKEYAKESKRVLARMEMEQEKREEWHRKNLEQLKSLPPMSYLLPTPYLSGYIPHNWAIPRTSSYQRTIEGCLDWIVAGRPLFAKKVEVV